MGRIHAGTRVLAIAALLASYGCDSSSDDPGTGAAPPLLAAFNAVPDLSKTTFLREEEVWSELDYGTATQFRSVTADQYDVNFDALLPGDDATTCAGDIDKDGFKDPNECTRLRSEAINVINDHEYVVALLGRYENLRVAVYDKVAHTFDTTTDDGDPADTNAEVQFFHWSEALGEIDVYLEPPGTNLSAVQSKATLRIGEQYHGLVEAGNYVLSLTPVANPGAALYTSQTFAITKQTRVAFGILEGTEESTAPIRVSRFRDQGGDLPDRWTETELRITHVARRIGKADIYAQDDYSTPFFANLSFRESSPYQIVPATEIANVRLDITPAGNPGMLLAQKQFNLSSGSRSTVFLVEPHSVTATVDALLVRDRLRRVAPYASVRLLNSAGVSLDFYVIPHGNNVYTSTPRETLSTGSSGAVHMLAPGSYDVFLARAGTNVFVHGPLNVELLGSGTYTAAAVATTDATRADVVLLDDFVE